MPSASVLSAAASRGTSLLYGHERLEKAMYALFQRMRKMCEANNTNGVVFFDQGHPEYRRLYRRAQVFLPTGSAMGTWQDGQLTKNLPLTCSQKMPMKRTRPIAIFTQTADMVAYAAFLKIKAENDGLTDWQKAFELGSLYDHLPRDRVNTKVSNEAPRDGIVRLK
jgi:hypothetical protein